MSGGHFGNPAQQKAWTGIGFSVNSVPSLSKVANPRLWRNEVCAIWSRDPVDELADRGPCRRVVPAG